MPRIVDGFIFYNEVEMLEYRLEVLWDVVDHFVVVEAPVTFTGRPKPMHFDPERYAKYMSKIVHVVVDDMPEDAPSAWDREKFQRNAIARGFERLSLAPEDILVISDVDEIPNPQVLIRARSQGLSGAAHLKQFFYYYNFTSLVSNHWLAAKIIPYGAYVSGNYTPETLRRTNSNLPIIEAGGWHCSYFGDPEFISNKIKSFSHQEFNKERFTDTELIRARVAASLDLFNRHTTPIPRVSYVPGRPEFPPRSDWLLSRFKRPIQKTKVAFFLRHFTERGTEVSAYNYADYNETILGNESIIIAYTRETYTKLGMAAYFDPNVFSRFNSRFKVFQVSSFSEVDSLLKREGVDVYYTQTHGGMERPPYGDVTACRYVVHCVFDTRHPHGDMYCSISSHLNNRFGTKLPVIPYIVQRLSPTMETLRAKLGIPEDAIVFGRHGGTTSFDIREAHAAVYETALSNPDMYFVFLNTNRFCSPLPNIIHLDRIVDPDEKQRFVNTCDAYLHARSDGETFGLAIAEFAVCDKPIISCRSPVDNAHLEILGDKVYLYTTKESLVHVLTNFKRGEMDMASNGYKKFSPEAVMREFSRVVCNRSLD